MVGTGMVGIPLVGGFAYQSLQSIERREHVGPTEVSVQKDSEHCGTKTPASQVFVKLVNDDNRGEILLRTDAQGQAVIPEVEVAKLDAPVSVYVEGSYAARSSAAVERGEAAAAVMREKRAIEEQKLAQERLQAREKLAQERLQAREKRAAAFRKSVKIGDTSHCGLVVEVKSPVVKIQAMIGERWLKIDQLYGEGEASCRFVNGAGRSHYNPLK